MTNSSNFAHLLDLELSDFSLSVQPVEDVIRNHADDCLSTASSYLTSIFTFGSAVSCDC